MWVRITNTTAWRIFGKWFDSGRSLTAGGFYEACRQALHADEMGRRICVPDQEGILSQFVLKAPLIRFYRRLQTRRRRGQGGCFYRPAEYTGEQVTMATRLMMHTAARRRARSDYA